MFETNLPHAPPFLKIRQPRVHAKESSKPSQKGNNHHEELRCIRSVDIYYCNGRAFYLLNSPSASPSTQAAMLSDAALYQSASHPDKARLIFNTQLHQALKNIAKNRELVPVTTPNAANAMRPVLSLHDSYGSGSAPFGRSTELNGWDLEKKMVALQEVCDLLQRPFFFYADWATQAAATARNAPVPLEKRMNYMSYFSKTLPLQLGQTTLLDLWDYVIDMCDHVPVRNRCRSLYLHVAVCICRRVEFIEGYELDDEKIHVDKEVNERYHKLLIRCVQFCVSKLTKSRFLSDDHKFFIAHIYTALFFRFPLSTSKLITAILDTTATLERTQDTDYDDSVRTPPTSPETTTRKPPTVAVVPDAKHSHRKSTLRGYRSPRGHCRHWNAYPSADGGKANEGPNGTDEDERRDDAADDDRDGRIAAVKLKAFEAFSFYKKNRGTDDLLQGSSGQFKKGARSVEASLELAFQQMMDDANEQQETKFFDQLPLLYVGNVTQQSVFESIGVSQGEFLDEVLEPFIDRLITPGRDDLIAITFIAAFLSDVSSWCSHRKEYSQPSNSNNNNNNSTSTYNSILWHCIPGYFSLIRLFLAVFQLMCQRRPRMAAMPPGPASVGRILSIIERHAAAAADVNPWLSYWSGREVEIVLEAAGEVLKNEYLANVLVKIVLETTNMHDSVSVNYSFGVLQRVLEVAAKSASTRSIAEPISAAAAAASANADKGSGKTRSRHHRLSEKFDDGYFLGIMRRALQSAHVQILLKVLTCLYNSIDFLPANVRKRVIGELILRENFFRFFMHWNEEIRKIFSYIIVFKTSISNRLDLPCASDRILLAHSPFFEASTVGSSLSSPLSSSSSVSSPSSFGYWAHLSDIAQSMLRVSGGFGANDMNSDAAEKKGASALKRLVAWDDSVRLRKSRAGAHDVLFRDSLVNEELSVDLSIGSKLDALFKMIADQMNLHRSYFPKELETYVERGLAQYVTVLLEYYETACENLNSKPSAPTLAFTITTPVFTD